MTVAAEDLAELLDDLLPIGFDEADGTARLAWTREDEEAAGWFARRAAAIGRRMERDPAGNLWACPDAPGPWWAVGSHLDTVRGGGRYDGALGVAAGFAVAPAPPSPWRSSRSPTRRARGSTRRPSGRARWSAAWTSTTRWPAWTSTA